MKRKIFYKKKNEDLQNLIDRYDKQVKGSVHALEDAQANLKVARGDLQNCKLENNDLKHKLDRLQARADELYAQVNTMN